MATWLSRPQGARRVDTAQDIAARVGGVGLTDVSQGIWVAEHLQGLLDLRQVLRADEHGCGVAIAGDDYTLVLALDAVDEFAEVITHGAERLGTHGHNCGPP